jgi:hypothetical protein
MRDSRVGQEPPLKAESIRSEGLRTSRLFGDLKKSSLVQAVRRFRVRRHHVRHVSLATIAVVALAVFFMVGAVLRLSMGPVSVGAFSGKLRDAIVHALPGLIVHYDDAALEWSRDEGRVNLIIVGAQVFDPDQHLIAQAPKAEIGLAAMPLIRGDVQVRSITLVGVQLTLVRTKDGALHLGVERDKSRGDVLERIRQAIEKSGKGTTSLEHLAVSRARLAFYDEGTGLFVVSPEARLDISPSQGGPARHDVIASVDAKVEITGQPAHIVGTVKLPRLGGPVSGDVSITGLQLQALAQNSKSFAALRPFDLRTDISGSFVLEHGTTLRSADLGVGASGVIGGLGSPLAIKSFRFVGRYDGATGRVLIDDATLEGQSVKARFQGISNLSFADDGSVARADIDVNGEEIALQIPGTFQHSVTLGRVGLRGAYTATNETFAVDRFWLSGSPLSGELNGRVVLAQNKSPEIDLNGKLDELSVRDLVQYWPLRVGEGARRWIAANMPAGRLGPVAIQTQIKAGELDAPALPEGALTLSFPVKDATVNYIRGLTLLTGANGTAVLSGDSFKASLDSGRIGPLAVAKGSIVIPNLHVHGTTSEITGTVTGQFRDVLRLVDMKPLQYPTRFHIRPEETTGAATVDGDFHVPMLKDLSVDKIGIGVKGSITGLGLTLDKSTQLSNGTGTVQIDNTHLHATGNLDLGHTRVAADWDEIFSTRDDITSRIQVRGTLDDAARESLNLSAGEILNGPVGVVAQLEGHRGTLRRATVTADLAPATISLGQINYTKAPGQPATAQMAVRFDPSGNPSSEDLSITGSGGLAAKGTLNFTPGGGVAHAEFPVVHAGSANDFALSLTDVSPNGLDISIRGKSVDGTALVRRNEKGAGASKNQATKPLHVAAHVEHIALLGGAGLADASVDYNELGGRAKSMSLTARLSKSESMTAAITSAADGRHLSVDAGDAGDLLRGVLGLSNISGGHLILSARLPSSGDSAGIDYAGKLTIRDFTIENQPFFARLFSAGSFGGLLDLMRGQGIGIDRLEMPFSVKGDVINIREAHASGPSVGLSGEGYVDRGANQLELRGAVAPIYGINSFLGAIPLVGNILVSKEGEGIIGVTYTASGSLDEPKIAVNPLAMLTPGIFRRIFEGGIPSAPHSVPGGEAPPKAPH